jgi:uncharacterized caspase-like protein
MARVDRIALLLAELDNLVPLSAEVSAGLTQALAIISEEKLTKRGSGHPARSAVDDDGDPNLMSIMTGSRATSTR